MDDSLRDTLLKEFKFIYVDLDGTLINTDLGFYSLKRFLIPRFWRCVFVLYWWVKGGRSLVKRRLAENVSLIPETLPWINAVLIFVRELHARGHTLVLATGSDMIYAQRVSDFLQIFSHILASNGHINMIGEQKLSAIKAHAGRDRFLYIGNSSVDLAVWRGCHGAIVANASHRLAQKAARLTSVLAIIGETTRKNC